MKRALKKEAKLLETNNKSLPPTPKGEGSTTSTYTI